MFCVSRIRPQISLIGKPEDASLPPKETVSPRVSPFVSPVIDMRGDSIIRTLLHDYEARVASRERGSPRRGRECVALEGAELRMWMGYFLPLAPDVAVVSPELLCDAILTRPCAAAKWGEYDA